jgi:hypothetical protein
MSAALTVRIGLNAAGAAEGTGACWGIWAAFLARLLTWAGAGCVP